MTFCKKVLCLVISLSVMFSLCTFGAGADSRIRDISSQQMVNELQAGINIGNSLDSVLIASGREPSVYETCWGNPVITKELVDGIKAAGITTIRLPVTWYMKFGGAPDYTIDKAWLDRVQTIVDYIIDNDMYCILNTHHDQFWINTRDTYSKETHDAFGAVWTQIATRFRDYDDHLLFEAYNEILWKEADWSNPIQSDFDHANALLQTFVDSVRATGGNNADRFLLINTYGARTTDWVMEALEIPEDTAEDKIIGQVHFYPSMSSNWENDKSKIDNTLNSIDTVFEKKGIPVVIGEFGYLHNSTYSTEQIERGISYIAKKAREKGFSCILWDDGYKETTSGTYGCFNRVTGESMYPEITKNFINNSSLPYDANRDGRITSLDLYLCKLHLLDIKKIPDDYVAFAFDKTDLTATDLLLLKKKILGL